VYLFTSLSLVCAPSESYNSWPFSVVVVKAFVNPSTVSIVDTPLKKKRSIASFGNGECRPIGSINGLPNICTLHKTTLFSDSYSPTDTNAFRSKHIRKEKQPQQQFSQALDKSHQMELFKKYSEYRRVQSVIGKDAHHENNEQFKNLLSEGPTIRETLLLHNIGLVHYVVNSLLSSNSNILSSADKLNGEKRDSDMTTNLSKDDLIQEGVIGLSKAIEKFKPELNNAFSTYAVHWIRAGVQRCIYSGDELIRVPEHVSSAVRKLNKALDSGTADQLSLDTNTLSKKTGLTQTMVREAVVVKERRQWSKQSGEYLALEDWMISKRNKNDPKLRYDDSQYASSLDRLEREGVIQQLTETLSPFLSAREMQALSWRYGLLEEEETNFRDYESEADEDLFGANGILSSPDTNLISSTVNLKPSPRSTVNQPSKSFDTKKRVEQRSPVRTNMKKMTKGGRWGEAMSFTEVANQMRISGSYTRRLCSSALKKLMKAADDGRLDPSLLSLV